MTMMRSPIGSPSCCLVRSASSAPTGWWPKTGSGQLDRLRVERWHATSGCEGARSTVLPYEGVR